MSDSSGILREFVQRDLMQVMALKLDQQLLDGSGAGMELTGLRHLPDVTLTELGIGNGAAHR